MWGTTFNRSRSEQTTIPCHECGAQLKIQRSCHEVFMRCESCDKTYDIADYVAEMDDAMERFMEGVYCDRV